MRWLVSMAVLLSIGCTQFRDYSSKIVSASLRRKYLRAHNGIRTKKDLPEIVWDKDLAEQAYQHSKVLKGTCLPEDSFYSRFDNVHQQWGSILSTPKEVVRRWVMENDYELDNILHPKTLAVGCGFSICRDLQTDSTSAIHICKYKRDDGFLDELFEDI